MFVRRVSTALANCEDDEAAASAFDMLTVDERQGDAARIIFGVKKSTDVVLKDVRAWSSKVLAVIRDMNKTLSQISLNDEFDDLIGRRLEAYREAVEKIESADKASRGTYMDALKQLALLHSRSGIIVVGERYRESFEHTSIIPSDIPSEIVDGDRCFNFVVQEEPQGSGTFHRASGEAACIYKSFSRTKNCTLTVKSHSKEHCETTCSCKYLIRVLDEECPPGQEDTSMLLQWCHTNQLATSFKQAMLYFIQVTMAVSVAHKTGLEQNTQTDSVMLVDSCENVMCGDMETAYTEAQQLIVLLKCLTAHCSDIDKGERDDVRDLLADMEGMSSSSVMKHAVVQKYLHLVTCPTFPTPSEGSKPADTQRVAAAPALSLTAFVRQIILSSWGYQYVKA